MVGRASVVLERRKKISTKGIRKFKEMMGIIAWELCLFIYFFMKLTKYT